MNHRTGVDRVILGLYLAFIGISLLLIIIGFASGISLFNLVGSIMLFLLGFTLLNDGVYYKVGENTSFVYGDDYDGYHYDDYNGTIPPQYSDTLNVFHDEKVDIYETYNDSSSNRFGWLFILLGALAFLYSIYDL